MAKLHIANTFMEWELEHKLNKTLQEAFHQHPVYLQLQFLPLLYGESHDLVLFSASPPSSYPESLISFGITPPQFLLLSESDFSACQEIESWGPSRLIAAWAQEKGIAYEIPDWEVVKQINSKQFSFENAPQLPHATLLTQEKEALAWLHSFKGKKVLKTCYGLSGAGHLIIDGTSDEKILPFLHKEWKKKLPVIAEPWVERLFDFSTQWLIEKNQIRYLGATACENDERGQYQASIVGNEEALFGSHLPFLQAHQKAAQPLLSQIATLGFFGNIGIDAMVYLLPNQVDTPHLHPIVEINGRKTMGWAALHFQKRHFPNDTVCFRYALEKQGYLPSSIKTLEGKEIPFKRNLMIGID